MKNRILVGDFRAQLALLKKDGTCWVNMGDAYAGGRSSPEGRSRFGIPR